MSDPITFLLGDCIERMRELAAESVDAVVTDPPYGLEFMGKEWDRLGAGTGDVQEGTDDSHPFRNGTRRVRFGVSARTMQTWHEAWATEAFRVAKPGAHLLAFGGTRTVHRLTSAIEDAGWEIRDCLVWAYASGFPKSLDVSKAIDKAAGAEREVVGRLTQPASPAPGTFNASYGEPLVTAPATDAARQWDGWGTALKPAWEPIVMARKPLRGTVAANVQAYGTGALNIDATRIGTTNDDEDRPDRFVGINATRTSLNAADDGSLVDGVSMRQGAGRWPANLILTADENGRAIFDGGIEGVVGGGEATTGGNVRTLEQGGYGMVNRHGPVFDSYGDSGTYSRFFLIPKSARAERERGLRGGWDGQVAIQHGGKLERWPDGHLEPRKTPLPNRANVHPTVKPLDLMRHLVRLVTPPGGTILDPFVGSGTTALAASEEGFRCLGIDQSAEYLEIARGRLLATAIGMGLDHQIASVRPLGRSSGHYKKGSRTQGTKEGPASIPIDGRLSRSYDDGPR